MSMRTALPYLAAFALLAGCASNDETSPLTVTVAKSTLARETPTLGDAERTSFASERAEFSVDLLKQVAREKQGNVLVSPHSASIALAMTYAGTAGETKTGIAKALRFSLGDAALHAAFNATDLGLAARQHEAKTPGGGAVQLSSANSLWAQSRDAWEQSYLDTLAVSYGSGINLLDFRVGDGDPARVTINGWVSERTREKIPELLKIGSTRDAEWVLVNALYMKANWQTRFNKESTTDAAFTTAAGASVTVPTMRADGSLRAVHRDDYDAVELPYDGGELAMVAIIPAAGTFTAFASSFTGRAFGAIPLEPQLVDLSMPKFEVRTSGNITKALEGLGMPSVGAFPGGADRIEVIQETYLVADEDGTEAAAATAVIGTRTSFQENPPTPLRIAIDRPFLYAVVDKPTGAILFLGQTVDPTAK